MRPLIVAVATVATAVGLVSAAPALGTTTVRATTVRATSGAAPRAAVATASTIHWGGCPTRLYPDLGGTAVRCGALKVPLNYSDPSGMAISLEVSILRHTSSAKSYQGVMLSNPGGPGGEGLDLGIELAPYVPNNVGGDYDWVSWDPRGVGASRPALHCQNGYFNAPRRAYTPTSESLLTYWLDRSKKYAEACEKADPHLLNNITTADSAKDMNAIREALGVNKISYYGYSYGTYLGQVYSTLYPQHLKYMVLDSNVDPRQVWYQANLAQDRAFDRNIKIYFAWMAKYHKHYHLGSTQQQVAAGYYKILAALTRHPAGKLGPDEWADAIESAAYYQSTWPDLGSAWAEFQHHHRTAPMLGQFRSSDEPGNDNGFAVYNAVQCSDVQWPTSWSRWEHDNDAYNQKYPFLTWSNAWYNAPCLYWGGKVHQPVTINGAATKSVLLIDETLDAATPYEGSLEVRKLYPHSSLLAEPGGTTHADSLDGDACVDTIIATYLKTGKRPARKAGHGPDATCRPLPPPTP